MLEGRFVLARATSARDSAPAADVLALVFGPDGATEMRRDDAARDSWSALWNGDAIHDPEATGMLSAIVGPLAAGEIPVWVAASYDGDLILVPTGRLEKAVGQLRGSGHHVSVPVRR